MKDSMKIAELFPLVFDYESNSKQKDIKYNIIRAILNFHLADKHDVASIIRNHTFVCNELKEILVEFKHIESHLTDMYSYPEVFREYAELVEAVQVNSQDNDDGVDVEEVDDEEVDDEEVDDEEVDDEEVDDDDEEVDDDDEEVEVEDDNEKIVEYQEDTLTSRIERIVKINTAISLLSLGISLIHLGVFFFKR